MLSGINKILNYEEKKDLSIQFWNLLGPIFIVLTLFLTSFATGSNKDLFLMSVIGLALCWKKGRRGLIYTLIFFVALVVMKHYQITGNHLWQMGIESSLFLGFIISYLSFQHTSEYINFLDESKKKHMSDLTKAEEELKKEEDFHQRQHKNFKYEIERINLQLEEKKKEIDSFKSLVQSLRDGAKEGENQRLGLLSQIKEKDHKSSLLRQEIEDMKAHILTLENSEELYQRNKKLLDDLNALRVEKEQTHAINQSLAKMLSKEIEDKKTREKENESLTERLNISENRILSLQNQISGFEEKLKNLNTDVPEKSHSKLSSENIARDKELLVEYEKRYQELKKAEILLKQLKKQFEDKQKVLSTTRKELFLANEQLEKIKKDKELKELDETQEVKDLYLQIGEFEEEIVRLEEENLDLQEIVTSTMVESQTKVKDVNSKLKKKMKEKKKPLPIEEENS